MFKSSNPVFGDSLLDERALSTRDSMTINGTVMKTAILTVCVIAAASFTWSLGPQSGLFMVLTIGGAICGLIVALITSFAPKAARFTAVPYAILQGLFLGGISLMYENAQVGFGYPGIVAQAIVITFAILGAMLAAYGTGLIRATPLFRKIMIVAIVGIGLTYILNLVLSLFGVSVPFIHSAGPIGIGFSLFVVGIASLSLVLDFDFIEQGAEAGAPKYLEWYGAFGLMVSLIWLYIEVLRLLSKLSARD